MDFNKLYNFWWQINFDHLPENIRNIIIENEKEALKNDINRYIFKNRTEYIIDAKIWALSEGLEIVKNE